MWYRSFSDSTKISLPPLPLHQPASASEISIQRLGLRRIVHSECGKHVFFAAYIGFSLPEASPLKSTLALKWPFVHIFIVVIIFMCAYLSLLKASGSYLAVPPVEGRLAGARRREDYHR